jgi:sortase (surface protein transpeptidase)
MRPKANWVARLGRRTSPRRAWLLAELGGAAAALAGIAALIAVMLAPGGPPGPSAAASAPRPPAPLAPSAAALAKQPSPMAPPVRLQIPAIHVSAKITDEGLDANGALQVPPLTEAGVSEAGWYDLGPVPGQVGSAIIAGHVDSYHTAGVFYDLGRLVPGNAVIVTLANGEKVRFKVTTVQEYTKAHFPDGEVYGPEPYPALRLITCGGAFDEATGHYLSNIVAYARMD